MKTALKWKQQASQSPEVILLLQASPKLKANPGAEPDQETAEILVTGKDLTAEVEGLEVTEDQEVEAEHATNPEVDLALQEGMKMMTGTDSMLQVGSNIYSHWISYVPPAELTQDITDDDLWKYSIKNKFAKILVPWHSIID